ncbi:MAG: hypothetical protein PHE43_02935 [Candidatus Nanoarchaeia archaeon]|nr:hypothetical protein [Candidatus Nanoarchaeia archaeon]
MLFSKKGDVDLIEMIMVVIVILIILVLVGVFYFKFQKADIEEKTESLTEQRSDVLLSYITEMPELKCSVKAKEEKCLDTIKIMSFNQMYPKADYDTTFGFKSIKVSVVLPETKPGSCNEMFKKDYSNYSLECSEFVIYSMVKPNYKSKSVISTPVSLYYPDLDKYFIGKLTVETYE